MNTAFAGSSAMSGRWSAPARPDARFQIVGAHPTRAVRALASPARGIEVTGAVREVQPYLWQAGVSVAPLVRRTGSAEQGARSSGGRPSGRGDSRGGRRLARRGSPWLPHRSNAREFANGVISLLNLPPADRRRRAVDRRSRGARLADSPRFTRADDLRQQTGKSCIRTRIFFPFLSAGPSQRVRVFPT